MERSFNDLVKLDNVGVSGQFQDLDLSGNSLNVDIFDYLVLLKNLDSYFLPCQIVSPKFDFPKSAFSNGLANQVMSNAFGLFILLVVTIINWLRVMSVFGLSLLQLVLCFVKQRLVFS